MPSNLLRIISKGRFRNKGLMEWKSATCFSVAVTFSLVRFDLFGNNPVNKRAVVQQTGPLVIEVIHVGGGIGNYKSLRTSENWHSEPEHGPLQVDPILEPKHFKVAAVGFREGSVSKDPGEGIAITNRKKCFFPWRWRQINVAMFLMMLTYSQDRIYECSILRGFIGHLMCNL